MSLLAGSKIYFMSENCVIGCKTCKIRIEILIQCKNCAKINHAIVREGGDLLAKVKRLNIKCKDCGKDEFILL